MALAEPIPDLAALDLLLTLGRVGSISAAADAHGITQPAASMRLHRLERVLGVTLVERSSTGSRLSPSGIATVEWAAAVVEGVRALVAGTAALRSDARTHLRAAASLTVAEYLVPGWLRQLARSDPDVAVALEMGNTAAVAAMVADGRVEVGFIEGRRPPGRLRSRAVASDALAVVVAPDHPWARRRRPLGAAELARTPLVVREPGSGTREVLAAALAAALDPGTGGSGGGGGWVRAAVELGSTTAIKAATIGGAGPAVLSSLAVEAEVGDGRLVAVEVEGDLDLRRTIRAVWAPQRPLAGAAARLVAIAVAGGAA